MSSTFPTLESLHSRLHDPVCNEDFICGAEADVVGVGLDEGAEEGEEGFEGRWEGE